MSLKKRHKSRVHHIVIIKCICTQHVKEMKNMMINMLLMQNDGWAKRRHRLGFSYNKGIIFISVSHLFKVGLKTIFIFFKQTFIRFHSLSKDIPNSFFIIQIFILTHRLIVPKRRFYIYTDKIRFSTLSYAQEAHVQ